MLDSVVNMSPRSTPTPVTRERLATVALMMIRRNGVASITMRAIAEELGVRAASLYHHVRDKDALLDLVVNAVGLEHGPRTISEYARVNTLDEWVEVTRRVTLEAYDFHAEHPGIASLMLARAFRVDFDVPTKHPDTSAIALAEVDALVRAGLPLAEATDLYQTCARWTLAAIAAETSRSTGNHALGRHYFEHGNELILIAIRQIVEQHITTEQTS